MKIILQLLLLIICVIVALNSFHIIHVNVISETFKSIVNWTSSSPKNLLISWLMFGFIFGVTAGIKGLRGGFVFWTVGCMIFPPSFLIVLFSKSYKKCPDCRETIYKEARVCSYCRKEYPR